jgi:hypothetical protein
MMGCMGKIITYKQKRCHFEGVLCPKQSPVHWENPINRAISGDRRLLHSQSALVRNDIVLRVPFWIG